MNAENKKSFTCDVVMKVQSFDEHPDEHSGPGIFERHVEGLAHMGLYSFLLVVSPTSLY